MVFHGGIGMGDGNAVESTIARDTRSVHQQLQVHHVVDDDGKLPSFAGIPRENAAYVRVETGRECTGRLHDHIFVGRISRQTVSVTVTVVDDKADVMGAFVELLAQEQIGESFRLINDEGVFVTDLNELAELNKDAKIWRVKSGELPRFAHSWAVEGASFLRINNITLGYTVPQKIAQKLRLQNLRIYATAYNIYTWTNYSGFDPEVSSLRSNPLTPGVDYSAYPKSFSMIFGINITF